MLTYELISTLEEQFDPPLLRSLLEGLLCIPEAWQSLHNETFLEQFIVDAQDSELKIQTIIETELGLPLGSNLDPVLSEQARQIRELASSDQSAINRLRDVALLAHEISQIGDSSEAGKIIQSIIKFPENWSSAFILAWPQTVSPLQWISRLAKQDEPSLDRILTLALIANLDVEEVERHIANLDPSTSYRLFAMSLDLGYSPLIAQRSKIAAGEIEAPPPQTVSPFHSYMVLTNAKLARFQEKFAEAQELLQVAWERSVEETAKIADEMADTAEAEGVGIVCLEARKQALEIKYSSRRRAKYALALAELNRLDEATKVLDDDPTSIEEKVAQGFIFSTAGNHEQALNLFSQSVAQISESPNSTLAVLSRPWMKKLVGMLRENGYQSQAILAAKYMSAQALFDVQTRLEYSELLHSSGKFESAITEAQISALLDPSSQAANMIAGKALKELGYPREAIPYLERVMNENPESKIALAECLLAIEDYSRAKAIAQSLLEEDPESPDSLVLMGNCIWEQGDHSAAGRLFNHAIEIAPRNVNANLALVDYLRQVQGDESAEIQLRKALQELPGEILLQIRLADLYRSKKEFQQALEIAKRAAGSDPTRVEALILYAELLVDAGFLDDAQITIDAAFNLAPNRWEVLYTSARIRTAQGEMTDARSLIEHLPESASGEAHLLAGQILLAHPSDPIDGEDLRKADSSLQLAEARGCTNPQLLYWKGKLNEATGDFANAFQSYKSFISDTGEEEHYIDGIEAIAKFGNFLNREEEALKVLEPRLSKVQLSTAAYENIVRMYITLNQISKANRFADLAISIDSQSPHSLIAVGTTALAVGDYIRAKHAFNDLISIEPGSADGWIGSARADLYCGKSEDVRDLISRAISLENRSAGHMHAAAELLNEIGETRGAIRILLEENERSPNNPEILALLASISEDAGDFSTAVDAWRGIAKIASNPNQMNQAARALWDLGQTDQALDILQDALKENPLDSQTRSEYAQGLLEMGRWSDALEAYREGHKIDPDDYQLAFETGWAEISHGSVDNAQRIFSAFLTREADDGRIHIALAECLLRKQDWGTANFHLSEAQSLGVQSGEILPMLIITDAKLGNRAGCAEAVAQVDLDGIETDLDSFRVAQGLIFLGEPRKALELVRNSIGYQTSRFMQVEAMNLLLLCHENAWIYEAVGALGRKAALLEGIEMTADDFEAAILMIEGNSEIPLTFLSVRVDLLRDPAMATAEISQEANLDDWIRENTENAVRIAHIRSQNYRGALEIEGQKRTEQFEDIALILRGIAFSALGEFNRARETLSTIEGSSPYSPISQYLVGRAYLAENKIQEALSTMQAALTQWPEESSWQFEIASLMLSEGEIDNSIAHFQLASLNAPDNGEYHLGYARALRDTGHLSEAENSFKDAIQKLPATANVFKEAAAVALASGDAGLSSAWFSQALSLSPADQEALIGATKAEMLARNYEEASLRCQEALRRSPDHPEFLSLQGEIYTAEGKYPLALESYENALHNADDPTPIHQARSRLLAKMGDPSGAAEVMRELTEIDPENVSNWLEMAELCRQTGDLEGTINAIKSALKISPSDPAIRLNLARMYRETGQLDRALDEILQLQSERPTDGKLALELADIYENRREHSKALDAYERAIELDSNSIKPYLKAGLLLRGMKAYEKAADLLERAVELNPKDAEAVHQLAAVRALELVHGGFQKSTVTT